MKEGQSMISSKAKDQLRDFIAFSVLRAKNEKGRAKKEKERERERERERSV